MLPSGSSRLGLKGNVDKGLGWQGEPIKQIKEKNRQSESHREGDPTGKGFIGGSFHLPQNPRSRQTRRTSRATSWAICGEASQEKC